MKIILMALLCFLVACKMEEKKDGPVGDQVACPLGMIAPQDQLNAKVITGATHFIYMIDNKIIWNDCNSTSEQEGIYEKRNIYTSYPNTYSYRTEMTGYIEPFRKNTQVAVKVYETDLSCLAAGPAVFDQVMDVKVISQKYGSPGCEFTYSKSVVEIVF